MSSLSITDRNVTTKYQVEAEDSWFSGDCLPGEVNACLPGESVAPVAAEREECLPGEVSACLPGEFAVPAAAEREECLPGEVNACLPGE
ncbi:hypothetical protein ACFXJO_21215 [Streptomyces lavendulae]|uniref:hypothetical protein n=1 Tax=Streptomyces lavendulae TaxID=1914 RepID=UPI0036802C88